MCITKNICANIISFLGNLILLLMACYLVLASLVYPDYLLDGIIFTLLNICFKTYIYIIPSLFILGPIEDIFVNKIFNKKYSLNYEIKNKYLRCAYNILFWIGFICSCLYLILYIQNI